MGLVWWVAWAIAARTLLQASGRRVFSCFYPYGKGTESVAQPSKISGCCGRLMCCLRYEYETYKGLIHVLLNMAQRLSAWRRCPRNRNQCSFGARHPSAGRRQIHQGSACGNGIQRRRKASHRCIRGSVRSMLPPIPLMYSAPPPSKLLRSAATKSSLITNRVKPAKASVKRKTPIASPAAVVVAAVHRAPKANPLTRAKALRIRRNLLLRKKERGSVAPFAPWLRQGKQAPAAGQAGSAEPAQRRAQEKAIPTRCKASRP